MRGRRPNITLLEPLELPSEPCPAPPAWLSEDAKAIWRKTAPELHRHHLLTDDTAATLEHYCCQVGLVRECEAIMRQEGRLQEGKLHPAFKIQASAIREARQLAAELALTPHRKGAAKKEGAEADGWDSELLA